MPSEKEKILLFLLFFFCLISPALSIPWAQMLEDLAKKAGLETIESKQKEQVLDSAVGSNMKLHFFKGQDMPNPMFMA